MTPLEKIQSMKMPFAELKGVTFTEAGQDRVVAKMVVRPDLCTLRNTIHGGAVMAFADSVGAAATVINLPEDAKGTTTLETKSGYGLTVEDEARPLRIAARHTEEVTYLG
ncbi:MAG: PaaI family thioesterase, partial [Bradyrhizobium sp.]